MSSTRLPIRQGDVLLIPVNELPTGLHEVPRDDGRLILAYGEATGHAHVLVAPPEQATLLESDTDERFVRLRETAYLRHLTGGGTQADHAPLLIEPGLYRLPPQVEWTDDDEPSRVID